MPDRKTEALDANGELFARFPPMVFVDLETTGGTTSADRITEVGLVEVSDAGVSEWSSLVNPGTRIPPFIESLTGISNAMVRDAPRFESLATALQERLRGKLFVAHNARFDYGFLKNEFKRLGLEFQSDVLCTVRLSRKLNPQHSRHNLDALVQRHQLQVSSRHRALGDAQLIWQFWQDQVREHGSVAVQKAVTSLTSRPSVPPHLDAAMLDAIPEGHGVYLFYGETPLPLYIGKSKTLRKRVMSHFSADHRSAKEMSLSQQVRRIEWIETEGELGSLLKEAALIKSLLPTHNQRLRRSAELCSWQLEVSESDGYESPILCRASDLEPGRQDGLFGLFSSARDAKKQLTAIADEHALCQVRLGLEKVAAGRPCFAHQLGRCAGACVGKQPASLFNAELRAALLHLKIAVWPFTDAIGLREGKDLHIVDAWCHLGTAQNDEQVWDILDSGKPTFDKDSYKIIRALLPKAQIVRLPAARPSPAVK